MELHVYVIHHENSFFYLFGGGGWAFVLVCVPLSCQLYIESSHTINLTQVKMYLSENYILSFYKIWYSNYFNYTNLSHF